MNFIWQSAISRRVGVKRSPNSRWRLNLLRDKMQPQSVQLQSDKYCCSAAAFKLSDDIILSDHKNISAGLGHTVKYGIKSNKSRKKSTQKNMTLNLCMASVYAKGPQVCLFSIYSSPCDAFFFCGGKLTQLVAFICRCHGALLYKAAQCTTWPLIVCPVWAVQAELA